MRRGVRKALWVVAAALAVMAATAVTGYGLARAHLFPKRYRDMVLDAAGEFDLDPLLVAAVIHRESGFDPKARSRAGARGLMQLMPATAQEVAGTLGLDGYNEAMLEEPRTNVRLGCAYLRELLERFEGDEPVALAAYNAGPGNVARWLGDAGGDAGRMLEEHAFPETRRYVRGVFRTRGMLRRLEAIHAF